MIINDKDALSRLGSPMNLMNKLRTATPRSGAMSLFGIGKKEETATATASPKSLIEEVTVKFNPFQATPVLKEELQPSLLPQLNSLPEMTTLDNILENHDSQIRLGLAHDKALELLNSSVALLAMNLDDVKADKLPSVITAASKVVESIRRERNDAAKSGADKEVHYHFYTPVQRAISDYPIIDVTA